MPLTGAVITAVDRIYRSGDRVETAVSDGGVVSRRHRAEECGPCWKVTSSAGRVLLFRAPTPDSRAEWIAYINQWASAAFAPLPSNGIRRRSSRATTPTAESPLSSQLWLASDEAAASASPKPPSVAIDTEVSDMLRDAMLLVNRQKQEILEIKAQMAKQQVQLLHREKAESIDADEDAVVQQGSPIVVSTVPPPPPLSTSSSTSSSSAPVPSDRLSLEDHAEDVDHVKTVGSFAATSPVIPGFDAATNKSLQEQAAALAEMARSLNRDEHESATVLTRSRSDGKEDRAAAMASSPLSLGEASNDFLQQQAIELAEIAKSLQSSFRLDRQVRADLLVLFTVLVADMCGCVWNRMCCRWGTAVAVRRARHPRC